MKRSITFDRDGLTRVGDLYTPDNFDEDAKYPAVLVQGSGRCAAAATSSVRVACLDEDGSGVLCWTCSSTTAS